MFWKIILIIIVLILSYYLIIFILNIFNKVFNPYNEWYKKNKNYIIKTNEELPGFGQWMRYNQKIAIIFVCIIVLFGLLLLLFLE